MGSTVLPIAGGSSLLYQSSPVSSQEPTELLSVGYRFAPKEEELAQHYLYNYIVGNLPPPPLCPIQKHQLYGEKEPWELWEQLQINPDLEPSKDVYLFTELQAKSKNPTAGGKRTHVSRKVGRSQGSWHAEDKKDGTIEHKFEVGGVKWMWIRKRFSYKNRKYDKENGKWTLHEFSLAKDERVINFFPTVVCMLRNNKSPAAAEKMERWAAGGGKKRKLEQLICNGPAAAAAAKRFQCYSPQSVLEEQQRGGSSSDDEETTLPVTPAAAESSSIVPSIQQERDSSGLLAESPSAAIVIASIEAEMDRGGETTTTAFDDVDERWVQNYASSLEQLLVRVDNSSNLNTAAEEGAPEQVNNEENVNEEQSAIVNNEENVNEEQSAIIASIEAKMNVEETTTAFDEDWVEDHAKELAQLLCVELAPPLEVTHNHNSNLNTAAQQVSEIINNVNVNEEQDQPESTYSDSFLESMIQDYTEQPESALSCSTSTSHEHDLLMIPTLSGVSSKHDHHQPAAAVEFDLQNKRSKVVPFKRGYQDRVNYVEVEFDHLQQDCGFDALSSIVQLPPPWSTPSLLLNNDKEDYHFHYSFTELLTT